VEQDENPFGGRGSPPRIRACYSFNLGLLKMTNCLARRVSSQKGFNGGRLFRDETVRRETHDSEAALARELSKVLAWSLPGSPRSCTFRKPDQRKQTLWICGHTWDISGLTKIRQPQARTLDPLLAKQA
jgi:hypothetical protein